jgi:hypothetical protein
MAALHRITYGNITLEHRTSWATSGLFQNYYPISKYITTPEQHQVNNIGKFKKPDYAVETLDENNEFYHVLYLEVKSLVNSNFNSILDQLYDSILDVVDMQGDLFLSLLWLWRELK